MKVECPRCQTHVEKPEGGDPVCPTCGFGAPAGTPRPAAPLAPGTPAAPVSGAASTPSMGIASTEPTMAPAWNGSNDSRPDSAWGDPQAAPKTGMAIAALVLGVVGFLTGIFVIGIGLDIAAIVLGLIAMQKAKAQPARYGGRGLALTGLIFGAVGLVLTIMFFALAPAIASAACDAVPEEERPPECDEFAVIDPAPIGQGLASLWPAVLRPALSGMAHG